MNICFIIHNLGHLGGAENQLALLAKALYDRGHKIHVIAIHSGGLLEQQLEDYGINIYSLNKKSQKDIPQILYQIRAILKNLKSPIIYGFGITGNLYSLLAIFIKGKSKIVWGIRHSDPDLKNRSKLSKFHFKVSQLLSHVPDCIIANSNAGRHYHVQHGFSEKNFQVIHNGVDTGCFYSDQSKNRATKMKLKIPDNKIIIGMVARIVPVKNQSMLLIAAKNLLAIMPNIHFIFVGKQTPEYFKQLKTQAQDLEIEKNLSWIHSYENMVEIYNIINIHVLTSNSEGFPNVLAEAMACGIPCIATDAGDARLILEDTGNKIINTNDSSMLTKQLLCYLKMDTQTLKSISQESIVRMQTQFSIKTLANYTETLFQQLYK